MQSSIHNKDFLLERDSKAHSCPARALPGCSDGIGGLCRTPEGHGGTVPAAGEQSQHWWPYAVPLRWGLQGGARTGESRRPAACRTCATPRQPWEAFCELINAYHVSLWPSHKPESRRSKLIVKLLFFSPFLGCKFYATSLREHSIKWDTKAGFSSLQCRGEEDQI